MRLSYVRQSYLLVGEYLIPGNRILEIIPGNTIRNRGSIFKHPANMVPPLTWIMFFAARAL